jgi:hypothetical protein
MYQHAPLYSSRRFLHSRELVPTADISLLAKSMDENVLIVDSGLFTYKQHRARHVSTSVEPGVESLVDTMPAFSSLSSSRIQQ